MNICRSSQYSANAFILGGDFLLYYICWTTHTENDKPRNDADDCAEGNYLEHDECPDAS